MTINPLDDNFKARLDTAISKLIDGSSFFDEIRKKIADDEKNTVLKKISIKEKKMKVITFDKVEDMISSTEVQKAEVVRNILLEFKKEGKINLSLKEFSNKYHADMHFIAAGSKKKTFLISGLKNDSEIMFFISYPEINDREKTCTVEVDESEWDKAGSELVKALTTDDDASLKSNLLKAARIEFSLDDLDVEMIISEKIKEFKFYLDLFSFSIEAANNSGDRYLISCSTNLGKIYDDKKMISTIDGSFNDQIIKKIIEYIKAVKKAKNIQIKKNHKTLSHQINELITNAKGWKKSEIETEISEILKNLNLIRSEAFDELSYPIMKDKEADEIQKDIESAFIFFSRFQVWKNQNSYLNISQFLVEGK